MSVSVVMYLLSKFIFLSKFCIHYKQKVIKVMFMTNKWTSKTIYTMCLFSINGSQQFGTINLQGVNYKKKKEKKTKKEIQFSFLNHLIPFLICPSFPFPFGFLFRKHD